MKRHPRRHVDYLEAEASCIGLDRPGVDILELGSGVGWLGMCMAANLLQARSITCTEQASGGAVAWLQQNVAMNNNLNLSRLRCCACDWAWFGPQDREPTSTQNSCDATAQPAAMAPATSPDRPCPAAKLDCASSISGSPLHC